MKTNSQGVIEFLLSDGFKCNDLKNYDDSDFTYYRRTKYDNTKECLCNDKVPQICVKGYSFQGRTSYQVEMVQKNNLSWVNFEYYGLSEEDIIYNLSKIEHSLIRSWESSFIAGE